MTQGAPTLPAGWIECLISDLYSPLADGRILHHGWSPQCEKEPSPSEETWGVLKTTAIQSGHFVPQQNKRLPEEMVARPALEVRVGDIIITCAGPRGRCGVACFVRSTRKRLMISGKMYRFRVPETHIEPRYIEAFLRTDTAQAAIDGMKTGISDSGLNLTHDRFGRL
jgi:type I restriction enzyme S subunit